MQKDMSLETISVFYEGLDKALERLGKQNIRLQQFRVIRDHLNAKCSTAIIVFDILKCPLISQ